MRRLLCAFLAFAFCTAALSAECPIGTTLAKYVQLEYIESTGTQYIDTGVYGTGNTKVELVYQYSVLSSSGSGRIFGSRYSVATNGFCIGTYAGATEARDKYFAEVGEKSYFISEVHINNTKNHFVLSRDGFYINDIKVMPYKELTFVTPYTLKIFGFEQQTNFNKNAGKCYSCKLWDNDVFVRDFIPAMRLSDGKPGMYDKVSGNFFTNAGTGEFIAGPSAGKLLGTDTDNCAPCPPNTYKDFVGNGECTPCPDALISPSGSKSVSECGRVLHVGDKIYHMKSVKQTSPSLHIRDENGNVWYGNLYSE